MFKKGLRGLRYSSSLRSLSLATRSASSSTLIPVQPLKPQEHVHAPCLTQQPWTSPYITEHSKWQHWACTLPVLRNSPGHLPTSRNTVSGNSGRACSLSYATQSRRGVGWHVPDKGACLDARPDYNTKRATALPRSSGALPF